MGPDRIADGTASKSEYARHRGVSPQMVTKLLQAGQLVMDGNRVKIAESDAAVSAARDPSRGGRGGKSEPPNLPAAPVQGRPPEPQGPTSSYTLVRTHREAFRAKTEEIEYRQRAGELVERRAYDKALADGMAPIMSALDSLSARLGPGLAAETDVRKVQNAIDDAISAIRQDMADTLRRMISGGGTRQ